MSYTAIASQTLTSSASSVTFSSIPGTFRDLVLVCSIVGTGGASNIVSINGDAGSNYNAVYMLGNGSTTESTGESNTTRILGNILAGTVAITEVTHFMDYSATNKHKSVLRRIDKADSATVAVAGRWANTSAITSFTIGSGASWSAGSTFSLYGVSA